jgi:hypothetical protein
MNCAPIVLFLYNRLQHSQETLEALASNTLALESELFVFIDVAVDKGIDVQDDLEAMCLRFEGKFLNISINRASKNLGLARSVSLGVTSIVNKYGRVIVLEDDLVTSPLFLEYMNRCLSTYEGHPSVYSINAYMHPIDFGVNEIFLSPLATSSWGWGTWKGKWRFFEFFEKPRQEIDLAGAKEDFNYGGYSFYEMFENKSSWAIHWYYSVFRNAGLGVFPTRTLVRNIGFDGSGTNCNDVGYVGVENEFSEALPDIVKIDTVDCQYEKVLRGYFSNSIPSKGEKIVKKIKKIVKKIIE